MDIRRDGWYGQLVISGVARAEAHKGSVMYIVAESLKTLQQSGLRPRGDESGESEILIRIRNKPFDASKESAIQMGKAVEVEGLVAFEDGDKPLDGESYEEFYARLLEEGYVKPTARIVAGEWFGVATDPITVLWLNDPKAIRFRELNSRDEMYEAALPSEYESLKLYVQQEFPSFMTGLTFRTA